MDCKWCGTELLPGNTDLCDECEAALMQEDRTSSGSESDRYHQLPDYPPAELGGEG